MKSIYLFIYCFVQTIICFGQEQKDSAYLQVTYLENYHQDANLLQKIRYDEFALYIGLKSSVFESVREARIKEIRDSVDARGGSIYEMSALTANCIRSFQYYRIYKGYPSEGKLTYIDNCSIWYKYEENIPKQNWAICPNKKEILGYKCQKAETTFRGRTWQVWYTTDIPISEGPWKLSGLPGLILDAQDKDSVFHFYCAGVKVLQKKRPISLMKGVYINCNRQELFNACWEMANDQAAYDKKVCGDTEVELFDATGKPYKYPSYKYVGIETDLEYKK
ncbi:GLPGLI family protein [uncultured Bacteroides sp.]|uniref:GLPGLI family protein n=1 Tax=uncultured Bacteroides sp. TaxID=162156 RepID=UPI002AAB6C2C|nr:GLPGLI family protein [uncultured Bacteroides sp.]